MFIKLLKSMFSARDGTTDGDGDRDFPAERLRIVRKAHEKAPREEHLGILFDDMRIGPHGIAALAEACVRESGASSPPLKAFHRPLASYFLARYFLLLAGAGRRTRRMRRVYRRQRLAHVQSGVHATPAIRRRRPASDRQLCGNQFAAGGRPGRGACRGWPRCGDEARVQWRDVRVPAGIRAAHGARISGRRDTCRLDPAGFL